MIEFRVLGAVDLQGEDGHGRSKDVLAQPKRTALLAYLACATPRGFHRRDTLLALFWPELSQEHARAALRQALHGLRHALGPGVLVNRGDGEVGLDANGFWCDVSAFDRAVEAGELREALDLYRGHLLEGFFISGAPEFERWLESERTRLRERAARTARTVVEHCDVARDPGTAVDVARGAYRLAPYDEGLLRQLIALLDRLGDRAGAVRAYKDFERSLSAEYEAEPAPETQTLIALVRSRSAAAGPLELAPALPAAPSAASTPRRWWIAPSVGLGLLAAVVAFSWSRSGHARGTRGASVPVGPTVGLAPFQNRSGNSADAYLSAALTEDLTSLLTATRSVRVVRFRQDRRGTEYVLTGSIRRTADTLEVSAELERTASGEIVWATQFGLESRAAIAMPRTLASQVLTALGVAAERSPGAEDRQRAGVDPVAYDLYLRGRYQIPRRTAPSLARAVTLLSQSIRKDSTFSPSWSQLARALHFADRWHFPIPGVPPESLLMREIMASDRALEVDSTSAAAWVTRALVSEDVDPTSRAPALRAVRRALALDSLIGEAWHQLAMALEETGDRDGAGAAWRRAIAVDPGHVEALAFLSIHYWWWRAYDSAAMWADSAVATDPLYGLGRVVAGQVALSRGRRDEAESQLDAARRLPTGPGSNGLSGFVSLAAATADTVRARRLLAEAEARTDPAAPDIHSSVNIAAGYAVLGDVGRALTWLERYRPARDLHFQLHLRLDPPLDPLRREPRFQSLLLKGR